MNDTTKAPGVFTNRDGHVFALDELPETVKGALFARYSRSAKGLRELYETEFANAPVGPTSCTPGSSTSTATTPSGSSAGRTWPASALPTC